MTIAKTLQRGKFYRSAAHANGSVYLVLTDGSHPGNSVVVYSGAHSTYTVGATAWITPEGNYVEIEPVGVDWVETGPQPGEFGHGDVVQRVDDDAVSVLFRVVQIGTGARETDQMLLCIHDAARPECQGRLFYPTPRDEFVKTSLPAWEIELITG